jgi:ankyrin repeat protein
VTIVDVSQGEIGFSARGSDKSAVRIVQEMRLSHFSVKEYFTSDRLDKRFHKSLCRQSAAEAIASVLLTYMLRIDSQMALEELTSEFPLCRYSARHWMRFIRLAGPGSKTLQNLTMQLLSDQEQYKRWRSIHDPDKLWQEAPELKSQPSPLYYASMEGLVHATTALLEKGADVNAQGGYYGTAICAASQRGHTQIVKLLVENKADFNGQVWFRAKFRSELERYQMTLVLLEQWHKKRLEIAKQSRDGVLQTASFEAQNEIESSTQMGYYSNALCAASAGNHTDTVKFLLKKGANVNTRGRNCCHALYTACVEGHERVVEILLENGADLNARCGYYCSALQAACAKGHEKVVEILLKKGADVNAQGGSYSNALRAACHNGHGEIAMMLLRNGANVDEKDSVANFDICLTDKGLSLVYFAAVEGHKRLAELLLEQGVNVNLQGGFFGNALQAACVNSDRMMVETLLEHGADVNAEGGHYANALEAASAKGDIGIVETLLEKGANVNAQGAHFANALDAAYIKGHYGVVKALLEKGADVILRAKGMTTRSKLSVSEVSAGSSR